VSDDAWDAVCDSLKTHPTLQVLSLRSFEDASLAPFAPSVSKSWIQTFVDVLKVNMTIHTMHLHDRYNSEHELFRKSVSPYLETNRLRPRLLAIKKTRPVSYRTKVVGRALLAVLNDANSF
jgi:hypothetical protein